MTTTPRAGRARSLLGFAALYAVAIALGRATRLPGAEAALVWPAAAVGVMWLVLQRERSERLVAAAALAVVTLAANHLTGAPWGISIAFSGVNLVLAAVTAALLPVREGHPQLSDLSDLRRFLVAATLGDLASAVLGALAFVAFTDQSFGLSLFLLVFRNGTSVVVGVAVAVRLRQAYLDRGSVALLPRGRQAVELVAATVVSIGLYVAIFWFNPGLPLAFLVVPLCVWVAKRFSTVFSSLYVLVAGVWIVFATRSDHGVFVQGEAISRVATAQALVLTVSLVVFTLALIRDERLELQLRLDSASAHSRTQADLFSAVLDAASEQSVVGTGIDGRIDVFNVGAQRLLGYRPDEIMGQTPERFHLESEVAARAAELGIEPGFEVFVHRARTGESETRLWTYVHRDGSSREVELSVTPRISSQGELTGFIGVAADVTERNADRRRLEASEERFRMAFDTAPVGMCLVRRHDQGGEVVLRVNAAMCEFTGFTDARLIGRGVHTLLRDADQPLPGAEADTTVGVAGKEERAFRHRDGRIVWGAVSRALMHDGDAVYLIEDVTARRAAEAELQHLALHDHLTGLSGRLLFEERLGTALAEVDRGTPGLGVIYLDLDGFKAINDEFGHSEGDELLKAVAYRLTLAVRPGDTVARLGGDEFAVICPRLRADDDAEQVAARLLASFELPFELPSGNRHTAISCSIGVAVVDGRTPLSVEQVVSAADQAMYRAKRQGKNRVVVSEGRSAPVHQDPRLLPELRSAVVNREFFMVGQQVVDLETREPVAVEMLIRWRHPRRGVLAPGAFLEVAESSAHIHDLGRFALDESCRLAVDVMALDVPIHVNVSGRQFESGTLTRDVLTSLERSGFDPGRLVLELTETFAGDLNAAVRADLQSLRDHGIKLAIDDIGTGYSSLARLTDMPFDILKIDRTFVQGIGTSSRCEAVLRAVIQLGQALDAPVITEGVETEEQRAALISWGCRFSQGFLFDRPSLLERVAA